ncbi:hypothetical protein B0T10DRAFT_583101 [Thelonectria olida]|uniref:C2H2-type domain-containing protein n=1 Tax=Thelonectria olida TaxID=1576542 RepID=A0A9P8WBD8_9HYPO|nr:hypothetical protein B0T10DRAFT_583101 [Thelonectria olida]
METAETMMDVFDWEIRTPEVSDLVASSALSEDVTPDVANTQQAHTTTESRQSGSRLLGDVYQGRRCSSTVDISASVAERLGYQLKLFRRKVYGKLNGRDIKGIGTISLAVKNLKGEAEFQEALVWEDKHVTFDIRFHRSIASRFLKETHEIPQSTNRIAYKGDDRLNQPLVPPPPSPVEAGETMMNLEYSTEGITHLNWGNLTRESLGVMQWITPTLQHQQDFGQAYEKEVHLEDLELRDVAIRNAAEGAKFDQFSIVDSGYESALASLGSRERPKDVPKVDQDSKEGPRPDDDAFTSYTSSTTDEKSVRGYVQEFAEGICNNLGLDRRKDEWNSISENLPMLIKAFAIKMGHCSDTRLHRTVMQFVHKHCADIIAAIAALMSEEDEHLDSRHQSDGLGGMSLSEKMALWAEKDGAQSELAEEAPFEGVSDDEDSRFDVIEISKYRSLVTESPPYRWLLSTLRKEMLLGVSSFNSKPKNEIKERILSELPPGVISKRKAPLVYHMKFHIPWDSATLLNGADGAAPNEGALRSFPTFTADSGWIHATSAEEYLQQMWPSSGRHLVHFMQQLVDSGGYPVCETLPDKIELSACASDTALELTVCGPAFSVAEYGEQIAWLGAATQRLPENGATSYSPYVAQIQVDNGGSDADRPKKMAHCTLGFRSGAVSKGHGSESTPWEGMLGNCVVVQGFPITQRPAPCSGIDAPFGVVKEIAGGGVIVHSERTSLWKLLPHEALDGVKLSGGEDWGIPKQSRRMFTFDTCRHFVVHRNWASVRDDYDEKTRQSSSTEAWTNNIGHKRKPKLLDKALVHGTSTPARLHLIRNQMRSSSSTAPDTTPKPKSNNLSFREIWSQEPESEATSGSISTPISQEESIDTEMLSFSDRSERVDRFPFESDIGEILGKSLYRLLGEWQETLGNQRSPGEADQTTGAPPIQSSISSSGVSRSSKRSRDSGNGSSLGEGSSARTSIKRRKVVARKFLACPFWKLDCGKHWRCSNLRMKRIKDVKQHLWRSHTPEFYCERCFEEFEDSNSRRRHIMADQPCPANLDGRLDGVSHEQRTRLPKNLKRGRPDEEQWYGIWDILFENTPRPDSPYIGFESMQDFSQWREHCRERGPAIVTDLVLNHLDEWNTVSSAERRTQIFQIVQGGFSELFEESQPTSTSALRQAAPELGENPSIETGSSAGELQPKLLGASWEENSNYFSIDQQGTQGGENVGDLSASQEPGLGLDIPAGPAAMEDWNVPERSMGTWMDGGMGESSGWDFWESLRNT